MSLYHYTDLHAVHSILKNKTIRLTDIRFLNDTEELRDGLTTLEETLLNSISTNLKYKENAVNAIQHSLINVESSGNELEPLFVFSLSSTKDQLSQWRAYGSYAIGFDRDRLLENVKILSPCIYDFNEKIQRSISEVEKAVIVIAKEMEKYEGRLGPHGLDSMIYLMYDAASFKHDGFNEERESRIIMPADDVSDTKYRPKNGMLIPYIEIELPLDCIKSIQIGPMANQELAYISMRDFVSQIERDWQIEISNIEYELTVEKSLIPYRE
ncbi:MAG: DUF2971 domain-containing protein [Candidatus Sedimenticola sp. (ex Thyasira tokunagai)]